MTVVLRETRGCPLKPSGSRRLQAFGHLAGDALHVRFFKDLLVRTGNHLHVHSTKSELAPAVFFVEGAEKLMPRAAEERDFARVGPWLVANERADVRFPEAALILRIRGEIDEGVHIERMAVAVSAEEALGAFDGGADFPTDKVAALIGSPGERI